MSEHFIDNRSEAVDAIPRTYDRAIEVLAVAHAGGTDQAEIYSVRDPEGRVVRLIEVSANFPEGGVDRPTQHNGVERVVPVFPMGPARDFPFRSEVVQVTPVEWEQLRHGELKLNRDWGDLRNAQKVAHGQ